MHPYLIWLIDVTPVQIWASSMSRGWDWAPTWCPGTFLFLLAATSNNSQETQHLLLLDTQGRLFWIFLMGKLTIDTLTGLTPLHGPVGKVWIIDKVFEQTLNESECNFKVSFKVSIWDMQHILVIWFQRDEKNSLTARLAYIWLVVEVLVSQ